MVQKKSMKRKIQNSITTARELGYPTAVVNRLKLVTTEIEIERIMVAARKRM